jgi:DNA-binding FadR family transcriptional regulator
MDTNMTFRPPRRVTIVEAIVDQFVQQIRQGALNPGDTLPSERQLIQILDVSRSSVRESLQGLTAMGLIEVRPGHGAVISAGARARLLPDLDSPLLADHLQRQMRLRLVEARRTVEPAIARLAAERATEATLAILGQRWDAYARDPFGRGAPSGAVKPHAALHLYLAEMADNPFFVPIVDSLLRAVPSTLGQREEMSLNDEAQHRIGEDELTMHAAIVAAVERRDGDAAFQAMDVHLDYERRLVMRLLPEDGGRAGVASTARAG